MKNKFSLHPATCFLLLFLLAALLSWTGSIYEWEGVRSLLSDEGLRWLLRTLLDDYILSPVFQAVVCLFLEEACSFIPDWAMPVTGWCRAPGNSPERRNGEWDWLPSLS